MLWDKVTLLGVSVVEDIQVGTAEKQIHRCPHCLKSGIKARSSLSPRYKCYKCKGVFDEPDSRVESVKKYRTRHGVAWTDLAGRLSGAELRELCASPRSQLSLRPLVMKSFVNALGEAGPATVRLLEAAQPMIHGGHGTALVRVRVGQAAFRRALVDAHGANCAFTGSAPLEVLEACHLYSYADTGQHRPHGGLLLRRDLHRLFDSGAIAVDPDSLRLDVVPRLGRYATYALLHGQHLRTEVASGTREWLGRHWTLHRGTRPGPEPSSASVVEQVDRQRSDDSGYPVPRVLEEQPSARA